MGETKPINLQSTSAWESAEYIVEMAADLLPHICKAIDAENASLRYAQYVSETSNLSGINQDDVDNEFWEQEGHYYADNIAKLEQLRKLLSWLAENVA